MKLMWCSQCEEMIMVEEPVEGHSLIQWFDLDSPELLWCDGPFFDSEPPTNDPDWDLQDEPSQEELVLMNLAAEELMQDLELL